MTEQNVKASLGELTEKDILIPPKLGEFSSSDFTNVMQTLPIGIAAAREVENRLRPISVSEAEYSAWQRSRAARRSGEVKIDIQVAHNLKRVSPDVIANEIKQEPTRIESRLEGQLGVERTWMESLHRNLTPVHGRGDFERLDYSLTDDHGQESRHGGGHRKILARTTSNSVSVSRQTLPAISASMSP